MGKPNMRAIKRVARKHLGDLRRGRERAPKQVRSFLSTYQGVDGFPMLDQLRQEFAAQPEQEA